MKKYRFPVEPRRSCFSPHDAKTLYHAGNVLFPHARRRPELGKRSAATSPVTTRNKQQWVRRPRSPGDNTGVEVYGTIFAIAESPKQKGRPVGGIRRWPRPGFPGRRQGRGRNVTSADFPIFRIGATVRSVSSRSATDAGGRLRRRRGPSAQRLSAVPLEDERFSAKTWQSLSAKLPPGRSFAHRPHRPGPRRGCCMLVAKRGRRVLKPTTARTWQPLKLNLPTMAVHDVQVKRRFHWSWRRWAGRSGSIDGPHADSRIETRRRTEAPGPPIRRATGDTLAAGPAAFSHTDRGATEKPAGRGQSFIITSAKKPTKTDQARNPGRQGSGARHLHRQG